MFTAIGLENFKSFGARQRIEPGPRINAATMKLACYNSMKDSSDMTYRQSLSDLENHLIEQLDFLRSSSDAYDAGQTSEAKRLAATLRLLLHDTKVSHSLLKQLSKKESFLDTADVWDSTNLLSHTGLVVQDITAAGAMFRPRLDRNEKAARTTAFDDWWSAVILADQHGRKLSRGGLVTAVANKDGGAHIDPKISGQYAEFSRNDTLAWREAIIRNDGAHQVSALRGAELASIRQIAHEVLKTLISDYAKPYVGKGFTVGMTSVHHYDNDGLPISASDLQHAIGSRMGAFASVSNSNSSTTIMQSIRPPRPKVGPNDPCVCGSGKKLKKCCG